MKKVLSLLLVVVAILSLVSCSKNKKEKEPEKVALEHVYLTEKLSSPEEFDINNYCFSGENIYLRGSKSEPYTDENGEELTRYLDVIYKSDKNFENRVEFFVHESNYKWDEATGESSSDYLENFFPAVNGGLWISISRYSSYPTDSSRSEWVNDNNTILYNYDAEGNLLRTVDVKEIVKTIPNIEKTEYDSQYISTLAQSNTGILYVFTNKRIVAIGEDDKVINTLEFESETYFNNVAALENGKIRTINHNWTGEESLIDVMEYDVQTNKFEKVTSLKAINEVIMDVNGNLYSNDYYVVSRIDIQSGEEIPILDWINSDINCDRIFQTKIYNEEVYAFEWDSNYEKRSILHLTPAGEGDIIEKYIITLAANTVDSNLKSMIIDYNRSSADYRISVKAYGWEEADATEFDQDLLAGKVPDLICLDQLDARKYATKGMFADLGELLDADDTISRESFLPNVLKASEINGKLYRLPISYNLRSLVAKASVVGDRDSWTWDDLVALKQKYPNSEYISEMDQKNAMETFLPIIIEDFVDYNTLKANFTNGNFAKFLDFIKTFPKEIDWNEFYEGIDWEEYENRYKEDKTLLQMWYFYSLDPDRYLLDMYDEPIKYIGFPSSDGNGNAMVFGLQFAIGANSVYKQQAWDFLKMTFDEKYQEETIWEIPVIASVAEKKHQEVKDNIVSTDDEDFYFDDDMVVMPRVTAEVALEEPSIISPMPEIPEEESAENSEKTQTLLKMADDIYRIATTTTKLVRQNDPIIDIIIEESAPYIDGNKTLDETCKVIESRVNLYLSTNM